MRQAHCETLFPRDPCLFVQRFRAAPVAELLQLDLPFHHLLVLVRIIIPALAHGATHRYEPVGMFDLRHGDDDIPFPGKMQRRGRAGREIWNGTGGLDGFNRSSAILSPGQAAKVDGSI